MMVWQLDAVNDKKNTTADVDGYVFVPHDLIEIVVVLQK